ncbi:MAG: ABC-F family ATP-binding cassette domain-containing protein, partial [Clostridia bacterium]|nr:ABC-F family ATP-binding cassette domain-containing protein [Clostridia bacterium]
MALFSFQNVTFGYEGNDDLVFEIFSCELYSNWRLALVGRNGRGKTTLLGLLDGRLKPLSGAVQAPGACALFPYEVGDSRHCTRSVMRLLCPAAKDWELERELRLLGVNPLALDRPYDTLSKGEQTKVQLCALFAGREEYPLIDEPTNHLDLAGRDAVAAYLAGKEGFLLISHDRTFLNRCADHVLALGRREPMLLRGNFSTYEEELNRQTQFEKSRSEKLHREIARLEDSVRQSEQWSRRGEKAKFH